MQIPRQQRFNIFNRTCGGQVTHDAAQPKVELMAIGFGGLQQRVNQRAGMRSSGRIAKQPSLATDYKRAYRILAAVVVNRQVAPLGVTNQFSQ